MEKLTGKQSYILQVLKKLVAKNGYPPTVREIVDNPKCGIKSTASAKQYLDLGYYLGIGGVITFKNSKLKDVIKEIGLDKVVFETDSPYLSPLRGKKNEPSNVKLVCEFVSDLLGLSFYEVAKVTSNNSITLFKLNIK